MATTDTPGQRCPACHRAMELTTSLYEDATPKPGDVTVCCDCAAVLVFGPGLRLAVPTREEMQALRVSAEWPSIARVLRALIRAKRALSGREG